MRNILSLLLIIGLFSVGSIAFAGKEEGFPGRQEFPKIPVMELEELNKLLKEVIVVDTRSSLEFDTLRINDSVNIAVADPDFEQQILKLREKTTKPIVFYCNGRRCYKSYIAVKKALEVGVTDTYAYDAGIFEWATAHPNKASLLGKSPVNIKSLIASSFFKKKLLDPDKFSEKIADMGSSSMVLDVRDKFQRAGVGFYPGKERWCSLDEKEKLRKYLIKAKDDNKTVFIYDEVGKQVQWLQYTLEEIGLKDYYFMHDGAKAYYSSIAKWK